MEERRPTRKQESDLDWNKVSKQWILISQLFVIIFLVALIVLITYTSIDFPYNIFVIGIEIALSIMGIFMIIRSNTIRRRKHRQNNQYR
jgi:Na+-driven multidrug efflux pump